MFLFSKSEFVQKLLTGQRKTAKPGSNTQILKTVVETTIVSRKLDKNTETTPPCIGKRALDEKGEFETMWKEINHAR